VTSKAVVRGLLASGEESLCPKFDISSAHCAENIHSSSALLPFYGETSRRLGSIALRDPMSVFAIQEKVQISKMSALTPKADIDPALLYARFVPTADVPQRWPIRNPPRSKEDY